MKVCGVDLKGNEAIICLLSFDKGLFSLPDCRARRLTLEDIDSRQALKDFQFAFAKLLEDYKVDKVIIRERHKKGKFAGGAISFKLEAAIELIGSDTIEVELITPSKTKEIISEHPLPVKFLDTGLKAFQEFAFLTAYVALAPNKT